MKSIFTFAAEPFISRKNFLIQLKTEWKKINRDRVATLIDLDNCFFEKLISAIGVTGTQFLFNDDNIHRTLQQAVNSGMMLANLPATLAKEKTRALLRDQAIGRVISRQIHGEIIDNPHQAIDDEMKNNPERLQAVYIGDWLDIVHNVTGMKTLMHLDILIGNGNKVLTILRALQNIPDYREHTPSHRPPGAHHKKEPERAPPFAPSPAF